MTDLQITSLLDKKLATYSLLGAAIMGVAAVAKADTVDAATIVPVNQVFSGSGTYTFNLSSVGGDLSLFINNIAGFPGSVVDVSPATDASVLLDSSTYPLALGPGTIISGSSAIGFSATNLSLNGEKYGYAPYGNFSNNKPGYLGFYYTDSDGVHSGFAEVNTYVGSGYPTKFEVVDYGYDPIAGGSIETPALAPAADFTTPEPSSLSLLAMGAAGVEALRRRYKKAA
jgi:hypothetical protein